MKKSSIFCILVASLIMMTGCKKDQDTVTLSAVINQPSKVFINSDRYPCWESGDNIYVNDAAYPVSDVNTSNRTVAKLQVASSANGYRAIYPASIVPEGSDILNNTVQVNLPPFQEYEGTNVGSQPYQKIRLPMGAYITNGSTLRFSNLCSVIKVSVNNPSGTGDKVIKEIRVDADNTYLSGTGTATVTTSSASDNDDDNKITISSTGGKKYVKLARSNGGDMKTITAGNSADFYIVVPEFSTADNITITVTATTGYKKMKFSGVTLNHSSVVTTTIDVSTLKPLPAKLVAGPTFKSIVQPNFEQATSPVTKIKFEYNIDPSTVPSNASRLDTNSPTPIYGYVSGDTYFVVTEADSIMANSECGRMFRWMLSLTSVDFGSQFNTSNTTSLFQMFYHCIGLTGTLVFPETFYTKNVTRMDEMFKECENLQSISFPETFQTGQVINMHAMFQGCKKLESLDLSMFNTERVTTMQAMFDACYKLSSVNLSSFNTSGVTTMFAMFRNCQVLEDLTFGNNFVTTNVTTMEDMFNNCKKLTELNLSNFNTSSVTNMAEMFYNCEKLGVLTLGADFTMSAVENCYDASNNFTGRFERMFAYTGRYATNGTANKCDIYCSTDVQNFFAADRNGSFHATHPTIPQNNAFTHSNAVQDFCKFQDWPSNTAK